MPSPHAAPRALILCCVAFATAHAGASQPARSKQARGSTHLQPSLDPGWPVPAGEPVRHRAAQLPCCQALPQLRFPGDAVLWVAPEAPAQLGQGGHSEAGWAPDVASHQQLHHRQKSPLWLPAGKHLKVAVVQLAGPRRAPAQQRLHRGAQQRALGLVPARQQGLKAAALLVAWAGAGPSPAWGRCASPPAAPPAPAPGPAPAAAAPPAIGAAC
jgi:hypothetical protein